MFLRVFLLLCCIALAVANSINRLDTRIINGVEATPGEFPHMVAILQNFFLRCGGTVIGNGWVVTAAHCVADVNITQLFVAVNLHDFQNPGDFVWYEVDQVIVHENNGEGIGIYPNDIALLKLWLNGDNLLDNVIPVADGSLSFVGDTCVMSGWGRTENGTTSDQLRKANVDVISEPECAAYWPDDNILDQQICAKGYDHPQGNGACGYDNGGPLVCRGQLAGIISWGDSGCQLGVVNLATVSVRTSYFYDWINSHCNCLFS